jgi:hypothetical protein
MRLKTFLKHLEKMIEKNPELANSDIYFENSGDQDLVSKTTIFYHPKGQPYYMYQSKKNLLNDFKESDITQSILIK